MQPPKPRNETSWPTVALFGIICATIVLITWIVAQ